MSEQIVLELTGTDGRQVTVFSEQIRFIRTFPDYSEIVYDKEHQIRVKESVEEIFRLAGL